MSIFEHVSVFISIILGLAVVHLLGGVSLILDARVRAKTYGVHLIWTANLLLVCILAWLGNFVLVDIETFSVLHFMNLLLYSMSIYLMSGLLYPVRGAEVSDFRDHFHANRVRFFGVGLVFVFADAVDGLLEARAADLELNPGQFGTLAVYTLICLIGIFRGEEWVHRVAATIFFLGLLGWLQSLTALGIVATG